MTEEDFAKFKEVQDAFMGSGNVNGVANKDVTWKFMTHRLDNFGEDVPKEYAEDERSLLALIQYNYFRSWPLSKDGPSGEEDRQNILMILNIEYLNTQGWINANNQFTFNQASDRFVFDGITWKASGDTPVSQNFDNGLHFLIVLKREEQGSGYNANTPVPSV